jgi:hypothetical protein
MISEAVNVLSSSNFLQGGPPQEPTQSSGEDILVAMVACGITSIWGTKMSPIVGIKRDSSTP